MTFQVQEEQFIAEHPRKRAASRLTTAPGRGKDSPLKRALIHLGLVFACFVAVAPILRVLGTALRPGNNVLDPKLSLIPEGATIEARVVLHGDECDPRHGRSRSVSHHAGKTET